MSRFPGMPDHEVRAVVAHLQRTGARYHVGGGWAVDALAGRQTRAHRDLDLFVDRDRCPELLAWLRGRGYAVSSDRWPVQVELSGPAGVVDVRPVSPDAGGGTRGAPGGGRHPGAGRTVGRVGGGRLVVPVASRQREQRAGHPPRPQDRHDQALLDALVRGSEVAGAPTPEVVGVAALAVVGVTVAVGAGALAALLAFPWLRSSPTLASGIVMSLHGALALLALWWVCRRCGVSARALGLRRPGPRFVHLLWQYPLLMGAVAAGQAGLVAIVGDLPSNVEPADYPGLLDSPVAVVLVLLGMCVLAPLWEELFFRGLLLGALRARWGPRMAVVVSTLVFAAVHLFPPVLLYVALLGTGLAVLRLWHHTLWASIAVHAANNTLATVGLLLALRR